MKHPVYSHINIIQLFCYTFNVYISTIKDAQQGSNRISPAIFFPCSTLCLPPSATAEVIIQYLLIIITDSPREQTGARASLQKIPRCCHAADGNRNSHVRHSSSSKAVHTRCSHSMCPSISKRRWQASGLTEGWILKKSLKMNNNVSALYLAYCTTMRGACDS